jgi:hypothetical protein
MGIGFDGVPSSVSLPAARTGLRRRGADCSRSRAFILSGHGAIVRCELLDQISAVRLWGGGGVRGFD